MTQHSGFCMCGAVSWAASGPATRSLICHCQDCQRATSSAFGAFIGFHPGDVAWQGEINHYESSPGCWRGFCPTCGTRLYFRSDKWPGEVHIHAATLKDPQSYRPDKHVVWQDKAAWLKLSDDLPHQTGFDAAPREV